MNGGGGDWLRPPAPGQFALRVAVLGGVALVMFAIIFLRLWYLEVLSGDQYLAQAQNNQVREFTVQAPRGEILDRNGKVLVGNRTALELQVKRTDLPASGKRRARVFERVGEVAGMTPKQIRKEIRQQTKENPASPVTLKRDVPYDLVYYLRENQGRFPGVSVERVYVRQYPQGELAAHVLGSVGEVSEEDLKDPRFDTLNPGDMVGQGGIESAYDSLLRGVNGATKVQVDARGRPTGGTLTERDPRPGNDLMLTIDADVQQAGQEAIASYGLPGGFVAMNIHNGALLGLGSSPSYDPSVLAKPFVSQADYEQIYGDPDDPASTLAAPAFNRAIQGLYPTGSTFKPITAVAALESGNLTTDEIINDSGSFPLGDGNVLHNAGDAAYGSIALQQALAVSSDVFFYNLGARMNEDTGAGGALQQWATALGLGAPTGLDVGGEGSGLVPSPEWRNQHFQENTDPDSPCGDQVCISKGELTDRPWSLGDNVNLAVGQGDLQADPLQMAVAYAAIANGGEVVRPHVGREVDDPQGHAIQEIDPAARRQVDIDPAWQQTILAGLHDAAMRPGGTSYAVFGGYPVQMAGKTGTAERPPNADQSWYIALAPYPDPKYVVAVTLEEGGFGADTAAPAARQILNQLLGVNEARIESVGSTEGAYE
ncbi:MAG: penicillin-binding protein 2 [Solirubrobacterales bacterium]|nr:penicillin-binding protein 2 [Solirubrobacterales bacterium]